MENDVLCALDGLKRLFDEVFARLDKHLNGHVVRDVPALNERAQDLILRLRRGGEAHLNLLKADVHEHVEHLELFLQVHRVNERLIAVAQVNAAPDRGLGDHLVRPLAVFKLYGCKRHILFASFVHVKFSFHFNLMIGSCGSGETKNPAPSS